MNTPSVLSISQLNGYIKSIIDGDMNLNTVFVCGEISNFTNHYRTGHFYLTLKDENSSIKAVMFRTANQRLKFMPENGLSVITRGRVSVFERDGQYQLYIDDMQPDGLGALNLAFEQLKNKLAGEGLFDQSRKKEIPKYPSRIGVITSPTGAAIRDILNILSRRFPLSEVVLCPVQVQGSSAVPQIVEAIRRFNAGLYADVLIVGRGGGSMEELWAFNEEPVARAVAGSRIPVISAVGHETDFTICDFVADLRAPTPSAAAELAVPDSFEQKAAISAMKYRGKRAIEYRVQSLRTDLKHFEASPGLINPILAINSYRLRLDSYLNTMNVSLNGKLSGYKNRLSVLSGKLDSLSPLKVLGRGYALAYSGEKVLSDAGTVDIGSEVDVRLQKGTLKCTVNSVTL